MRKLNDLQSNFLKQCFEEVFDEDEIYFDFVPIDDLFIFAIGEQLDYDIFEAVQESARKDDKNLAFLCFVHEWMTLIESIAVGLEYFEMASNSIEIKKGLNKIMKTI